MYFERLRNLRELNGETQEQIGKLLNCKRAVYQRYESGVREIPVWAVILLAEHYNCTVDYLLGLTDERKPYPKRKKR